MVEARTGRRVVGAPVAYGLDTFRGRVKELDRIQAELVHGTARIVAIIGRRGIGKSALAAKAVETFLADDPGAKVVNLSSRTGGLSVERIFLDCAQLLDEADGRTVVATWGGARGVADKTLDLLDLLGRGRYLVVLDNLEDKLDDSGRLRDPELAQFLDTVLRVAPSLRVLVTTQIPIAWPPELRRFEARVLLDRGLPVAEAVALLRELDRDGDLGLANAPTHQLERAARRVHGVPRALELITGTLSEDYLTMPMLDDLLETFARRDDIVAALAQERYARLDSESRTVLEVLAIFGRAVTAEAVAWVLAPLLPGIDVAAELARLAARGRMVTVDRASRTFALHPLDADLIVAELRFSGPLGSRVLDRKVANWYQRQRLAPESWTSPDSVAAHRWEFRHRIRARDHTDAAQLLDQFDEFLLWRGSPQDVLAMHEQVAGTLSDSNDQLAHLIGYGLARVVGGPLLDAARLLQEAVDLAERIGDRRRLQRALSALGDVLRQTGDLGRAVDPLRRSTELAEELGDVEQLLRSLMQLSLTHSYGRESDAALQVAERMEEVARRAGDRVGQAQARDARACAHLVAQHWQAAIAASAESATIYEHAGVTEALGYVHNVQGIAHLALGDLARAEELLLDGSRQGAETDAPRVLGFCQHNLAWVYWLRRQWDRTRAHAGRAAEALQRSGSADFAAASQLREAADAMLADDPAAAARHLDVAADRSRDNADLVRGDWLRAEAARLRGGTSGDTIGRGTTDDQPG